MAQTDKKGQFSVEKYVGNILSTIEKEREREIVSRRFGLYDRRETLEQIGELLGITRERVRQLEKSVVSRLVTQANGGNLPNIAEIETYLVKEVSTMGKAARISDLAERLVKNSTRLDQARVAFLSQLCPKLIVIDENDFFYLSTALADSYSDSSLKEAAGKVIEAIKKIGEPTSIDKVAEAVGHPKSQEVAALASTSKQLATLNGRWGLIKWPMVNPKNIRDKIYVILFEKGNHMHFSEIANSIKGSDFKRKDVTTQAIHNELIKDSRFVLVGRGIYALKEWGYKKGTVADVITEVLKKSSEPLHRDEIVKRVLKNRYVKETTILLNLQGKKQFKRVAKATYALAEE